MLSQLHDFFKPTFTLEALDGVNFIELAFEVIGILRQKADIVFKQLVSVVKQLCLHHICVGIPHDLKEFIIELHLVGGCAFGFVLGQYAA